MNALLSIALILAVGIGCQYVSWRLKIPAILLLLTSGLLAGPILGWLQPDQLFGDLLFPMVSLSIAVILFEGSLTLRLAAIPGLEKMIRNMISFGALITWCLTALATRFFLDFPWSTACLFGALMVVTGPTVIMPMIRAIRPRENIANVLQWEGILIDPIGAILAVLVYQYIVAGDIGQGMAAGLLVFARILLISLALGTGAGLLLGNIIRRFWAPKYLHNVISLALVCLVFALANTLEAESGLLAVTVMGLWLANMDDIEMNDILGFKESLSLILVSLLFIVLAARMKLDALIAIAGPALGVFAVIQFLARPLSIQLCAMGSKLSMNERHLLSWIAPRGIVAAAISALFAVRLEDLGHSEAWQLAPLTFMIIIGTVLLQSSTARPIARMLKVTEPEPRGFLIVGITPLSMAIAQVLQANAFKVLLMDQNWSAVREARMQGLPAYWGNPASNHAERHLNLLGLGHLLALSPSQELNTLATHYYRLEFEANCVHSIRTKLSGKAKTLSKSIFRQSGRFLFDDSITYQELDDALQQGAEIKTTLLSKQFTFADYQAVQAGSRLPLFALDERGNIYIFSSSAGLAPKAGWKIIALERRNEPQGSV